MKDLFKTKTLIELESINTKNLLRYYKAERLRFLRFKGNYTCQCCGELDWDLNTKDYQDIKIVYINWKEYLESIKSILNTREHVIK